MVCTANELFIRMRHTLKQAGITAYSLETREMISAAMEISPADFSKNSLLYLSDKTTEKAQELLARRLAGEPCAYLTGEWEFYSLSFYVTPDVLIPRPDTETLVEAALKIRKNLKQEKVRILDLGTGSGCVGITLAKYFPESTVVLADFSEKVLAVAKQNVLRHGLSGRVYPICADILSGWEAAYGKFDVMVSNPPYVRAGDIPGLDDSVKNYEPLSALDGGIDGLAFYRAIAEKWAAGLRPGGRVLVECGYDQAEDVMGIFRAGGLMRVAAYKDLTGIDRVVGGNVRTEE